MGEAVHNVRHLDRERVVAQAGAMCDRPDTAWREFEDVFEIEAVGFGWTIGVMVYEPIEATTTMPDGSQIGVFLLHGGSGDFRAMEPFARLITRKLGYKVMSMSYPGRLYLDADDRRWPGETINDDGTVRTPIWYAGEHIDPSQYDVVTDDSMRSRYGLRTLARARVGSPFYHRLAGWPPAFIVGMQEACRRHLGDGFSILVHGHSTGGPFVSALSQRLENVAGVAAIENSPFGYIQERARLYTGNLERAASGATPRTLEEARRTDRFDDLSIRTWREEARYAGPEAAMNEGVAGLMRLPELMEEVFEAWDRVKIQANFKCEYPVTRNVTGSLRKAAMVTAARLGLSDADTNRLIAEYLGFTRELSRDGSRPVPPTWFGITHASRDHPESVYHDVILPAYAAMRPQPRTALTVYGAGMHEYTKPEPDLPDGVAPAVLADWERAIEQGFFRVPEPSAGPPSHSGPAGTPPSHV